MKLAYGDPSAISERRCIVLVSADKRIELHIKRRREETFMLVCMSGPLNSGPEKLKSQGPFHTDDQARGAANAIATALKPQGFDQRLELPHWELHAQAYANNIRETIDLNLGDYSFDPKDVL